MDRRAVIRVLSLFLLLFAISLNAEAACGQQGAQPSGWITNLAGGTDGLNGGSIQFRQENGDTDWYTLEKKLDTPAGSALYSLAVKAFEGRIKVRIYCAGGQSIDAIWTAL
jgi:hypothetical protein